MLGNDEGQGWEGKCVNSSIMIHCRVPLHLFAFRLLVSSFLSTTELNNSVEDYNSSRVGVVSVECILFFNHSNNKWHFWQFWSDVDETWWGGFI